MEDPSGTIVSFILGSFTGGLIIAKDFSIQTGDFMFSTKDDICAQNLLKLYYKDRIKHLLDHSKRCLESFESNKTPEDVKKELVKSIIDSYLAPTSHDTLFCSSKCSNYYGP